MLTLSIDTQIHYAELSLCFFKVILNKERAYPLLEYNKNRFSNAHTAALQMDGRQEL